MHPSQKNQARVLYSRERERLVTIMRLIAIKLMTNKERTLIPKHNDNHPPGQSRFLNLGFNLITYLAIS